MLFWLKKTVSFWLMPLPFCVVLLVAGAWLWRRNRQSRWGRRLVFTSVVLFGLAGNGKVSEWLVRPLERKFPAIPELRAGSPLPSALSRVRYVVVLGGGNGDSSHLPALSLLSTSALGRLTEGVRLARAVPVARLIVSGPGPDDQPSHAEWLARAAVALGVDVGRIVKIETARDTEEEAAAVAVIVGSAPVAVVTSAWHMPRALGLFRHAGVDALPCPADYLLKSNPPGFSALLSWGPENLERTTWAWRERIGQLWLWLRQKS